MPALIHVKRTLAVLLTVASLTLGGAMMMTATSANAAPGTQSAAAEVCPELDSGKKEPGGKVVDRPPPGLDHQLCDRLLTLLCIHGRCPITSVRARR